MKILLYISTLCIVITMLVCDSVGSYNYISVDMDSLPQGVEAVTQKLQDILATGAANNKKIVFKQSSRKVLISKTLLISDGIDIDFNGNTIVRDPSHGVFDMIKTAQHVKPFRFIKLSNVVIDGNKDVDHLRGEVKNNRFSGLHIENVDLVDLSNVTVNGTVNAEEQPEGDKAGVFFNKCNKIICLNINANNNDRTGIFVKNSTIVVNNSYTSNNKGSGISGRNMVNSEFNNITTHDNGYSQLSVNGVSCKVNSVTAYNGAKGFSNINIGHDSPGADASNTIVSNIRAFGGKGWGLTIAGSKSVIIDNAIIYDNADANIVIMHNARNVTLNNLVSYGSGSNGVHVKSGYGHKINKANIYGNHGHGVEVQKNSSLAIGSLTTVSNNGDVGKASAGVVASGDVVIFGGDFYDDQVKKTQSYGLWAAGGSIKINGKIRIGGNIVNNTRISSGGTVYGQSFVEPKN